MRKNTKILLIVASALFVLGAGICVSVMTILNWDFSKLNTIIYESATHEITEEFSGISIVTDTADIVFLPSEDGQCKVVCYQPETIPYVVEIQDGTLNIRIIDERKWYEYIGIAFSSPKITVYLPQGEYGKLSVKASTADIEISEDYTFASMDITVSTGDVTNYASTAGIMKIKTSTGHICVENITATTLDLSVTTGETKLKNIRCTEVISKGDTGDIFLTNVIATGKFSIERDTGDVTFDGSDAFEIFVKTTTGDVKGSLLTEKTFIAETSTGSVNVPKSYTGGKCEVFTSTGDIRLEVRIAG